MSTSISCTILIDFYCVICILAEELMDIDSDDFTLGDIKRQGQARGVPGIFFPQNMIF